MANDEGCIVFVHGIFSSSKTWGDFARLIMADAQLAPHFDILMFEYFSPKAKLNPLTAIPDYNLIADALATFLKVETNSYKKIVLVAHSQGGLIVQRFLSRTVTASRAETLSRITRVIFFACPNSGAELFLSLRRRFMRNNPQEMSLRPINEAILDAQRIVLERVVYAREDTVDRRHIPLVVYAGESDGIVTPASARGVFPHVEAIPGNHSSILVAQSHVDRNYRALQYELNTALSSPAGRRGGSGTAQPQDGGAKVSPKVSNINLGFVGGSLFQAGSIEIGMEGIPGVDQDSRAADDT